MSEVDKQARHEYAQGQNDETLPQPEKAINDIVVNHPDTEAFYKGREGEQLDADKADDKSKTDEQSKGDDKESSTEDKDNKAA
jgi:hypothetical protein